MFPYFYSQRLLAPWLSLKDATNEKEVSIRRLDLLHVNKRCLTQDTGMGRFPAVGGAAKGGGALIQRGVFVVAGDAVGCHLVPQPPRVHGFIPNHVIFRQAGVLEAHWGTEGKYKG